MTLLAVRALDPVYTPTSQQFEQPDTTFMQDPAGDAALGLAPALGGLLDASNGSSPASVVAGKYLEGFTPTATTHSYFWMLIPGILNGDQWTVEFNASLTSDWASSSAFNLWTLGESPGVYLQWRLVAGPKFAVTLGHAQNPAVSGGYVVSATQAAAFTTGTYPAATWINWVTTFKSGVLTFYLNGTQIAQTTGVVAPLIFDATASADGLWLPGDYASGHTNEALTVSDVRVSRQARVPGQSTIISSGRSTITVTATPTGKTVQPLTGGLKKPAPGVPGSTAEVVGLAAQTATGAIRAMRSGAWLQATPILAGNTPSATYPTVGHSGDYCYDWQVVDRTLRYYDALGIQAYISLGGTPSVLGGSVPPFESATATTFATPQAPDVSGTLALTAAPSNVGNTSYFGYGGNVYYCTGHAGADLTGVTLVSGTPGLSIPASSSIDFGNLHFGYCFTKQNYNVGPPSSPNVATACADFGTMAGDLAYHILNELSPSLSNPPVYFSPWNEPDGGVNWETGGSAVSDYCTLYGAIATAIKAVSSSFEVGGPEAHTWSTNITGWFGAFITYCATNSLPIDFFSWHYYSGDLSEPYQMRLQLDALCAAAGLATGKPLINGEWSWQIGNIETSPWLQTGPVPSDYLLNDYHAAFLAAALIQQQAQGVVRTHLCDPGTNAPNNMDVLFNSTTGVVQANWNVFQLWSMITGLNLVGCTGPQTVACDPGIHAQACVDGPGNYYVLIVNLHYRKQGKGAKSSYPVLVKMPSGVANGTTVTGYLIDDAHSNAYDAGNANAALQTVPVPNVSGGAVGVQLLPRSVMLLKVNSG